MNERGADREGRSETGVERHTGDDRGESRSEHPTVDLSTDAEETPSSPGSGPDIGGDAEPPEPPDSATVRRWTSLTVALAVIAFVTATTILAAHAATQAAAGAAALGLGLGTLAVVGRTTPTVFGMLDDAWAEHRPYVWFSTGVFAFGGVVGALLYAAGIDLTELFLEMIMEEFGEDDLSSEGGLELSASFFIMNNTPPFVAAIAGALTLGAVTLLIMVFNGVLVGNIVAAMGAQTGFGVIFALLVPHGIFELPALFVAAGVGFRFVHRVGQRIAGSRTSLVTKRYLARTTALVGFAWLLLVLAAFVEAYVTGLVADALVAV